MRRPPGFTLIEILVASSVLLGLSMVLFWTVQYSIALQAKGANASGAHRQALLASSKLNDEMRSARVTTPTVGNSSSVLEFDHLLTGPDGLIDMESGAPRYYPAASISIQGPESHLVLNRQHYNPDGDVVPLERILARLGRDGTIVFTRESQAILKVRITVRVERTEEDLRGVAREVVFDLELPNSGV